MICVYLLQSGRRTYVGATVRFGHRLRQHNGELVGGAKYTRGRRWVCVLRVEGFQTFQQALQFEWKFKFLTKKQRGAGSALKRRWQALDVLLGLVKWTSNSPPAKDIKLILKVLSAPPIRLRCLPSHVAFAVAFPSTLVANIAQNSWGST